ncbi:hypothetical protein AVEN_255598-1 [Araneus ventricosus]|uniref:Uncharacterized protein n=1 Tax=Araneus ventricosus TaxID=182803 RepID=A0A4Y2QTP2_ARAVE|nr:hypothetical protein AVEN_255598-1 [Araneus ventricosus]
MECGASVTMEIAWEGPLNTGPIDKFVVDSYSIPDTPIDILTQSLAFKRSLASLVISSIAPTGGDFDEKQLSVSSLSPFNGREHLSSFSAVAVLVFRRLCDEAEEQYYLQDDYRPPRLREKSETLDVVVHMLHQFVHRRKIVFDTASIPPV